MKRRNILAALGSLGTGGVLTVGSGAFTSVSAERSVSVNVAGDASAYLRLAPCTIDGDEQPNGGYVHGHTDNTLAINLSEDNPNAQPAGSGVNSEALSVFHNVFEIGNQGTQDVCVDFQVDVPQIPGPVPDRYDFEEGDPAVVFYRGDDRSDLINPSLLDPDRDAAMHLDVGETQCIGFEVRAFGFDSQTDLFADANVTIVADANANCAESVVDPVSTIYGPTEGLIAYWPFDDGDVDDGTAVDASGNGYDGTVKENPAVTADPEDSPDNAVSFDGEDDWIDVGYKLLDSSTSATISGWFNTSTGDQWGGIFGHRPNLNSSGGGLTFRTITADFANTASGTDGAIELLVNGWNNGNNPNLRHKFSYADNEWHHLAAVYDGTEVRMYVNGDEKDSAQYTAELAPLAHIEMGRYKWDDQGDEWYLDGSVDEVRAYDRALSEGEVGDLASQF